MKYLKVILLGFSFGLVFNAYGQKSQKQMDLEKNRVQIFNDEERANVQFHFYEKTVALGLSDEVEAEYYRIVLKNVYAMSRIDDKDQNNTEEEQRTKLKEMVAIMNTEVKPILTKEQYQQHVNNFNDVLKSAYRARNWEWNIEE